MGWLSFTNITCLLFIGYVGFTAKNFYEIFNPLECDVNDFEEQSRCIKPLPNWRENYGISLCVSFSDTHMPRSKSECRQYVDLTDLNLAESFSKNVTINLPAKTLKNGTLTAFLVVTQKQSDLETSQRNFDSSKIYKTILKKLDLSKYKLNKTKAFVNLLNSHQAAESESAKSEQADNRPVPHLVTKLDLFSLNRELIFDRTAIPQEIFYDLALNQKGEYLPIVHVNQLTLKDSEYKILNHSQTELSLLITHTQVSIGTMRLTSQIHQSIASMKDMGFNDEQLDQLYSIFTDTDFYLLFLSFFVALVHLLFEFLAFKNDISFWRNRKTTIGISKKTLVWRVFSHLIIFFYLMEEETSLLILVPSGISLIIETWKMSKAFKLNVSFNGSLKPTFTFSECSQEEKESNEFDTIAMKKLSYLLYPIVLCGAVYSLIYNQHKSWYAWAINSLVNGIYAFGFLFMTPQLFMNYKLKTVAHLPWKAFMFKAFNTFIDDVFAFIIKMPTMHRLACFRDDVVFLIYLYQRWLYPIDKKRCNEYGETYGDASEETKSQADAKKDQ